jgi:hypothetical protein
MTPKRKLGKNRRQTPRWHEAVILDREMLLNFPNVRQVAIGVKEIKGKMSRRFSVKIYVTKKKKRIHVKDQLPKYARVLVPIGRGLYRTRRVPTDVVWFAEATFCSAPTDYLDPIASGALMAVPAGAVATYCCMVQSSTGEKFALTCGHLLRNTPGPVPTNRPITQPQVLPPGSPPGLSLLLGRTRGGGFGDTPDGFVDACTIQIRNGRSGITFPLDGMPLLNQVLAVDTVVNNRLSVSKFGAITGRSYGEFSNYTSHEIGGIAVRNVYEFKSVPGQPFGQPGDSGAMVVCMNAPLQGAVVGILFATRPPTPDAPEGRALVMPFGRLPGLTLAVGS